MPVAGPRQALKWYKSLASARGRRQTGAFAVEGDRAIRQILTDCPEAFIEILAREKPPPFYRDYPVSVLPEGRFDAICRTRTPQGILAVVRLPEDSYAGSLPDSPGRRILLLEDVQDPGNTGTLIRTAAAFGYAGVIMSAANADPFSPKCVQAAAGTVLSVWLRRTAQYLELARKLQDAGYALIAAEVNGPDRPSVLTEMDKSLLALGNEAAGLSAALRQQADHHLGVPTAPGRADSLNVAACGAILMYLGADND
jgi:TrmH family RNA methyltransferase